MLRPARRKVGLVSGRAESELGFEEIYAQAGDDLEVIPWASLTPHPALLAWLDGNLTSAIAPRWWSAAGWAMTRKRVQHEGKYRVSAFDVAPTAIARCQQRFPHSQVDYQVMDLFALPKAWSGRFDLVVEIRTLQSLAPDQRASATAAIARVVAAPDGVVWVRCLARTRRTGHQAPMAGDTGRAVHVRRPLGLRESEFREEPPAATPRAIVHRCLPARLTGAPVDSARTARRVRPPARAGGRGHVWSGRRSPGRARRRRGHRLGELVFDTAAGSRKCANLRASPRVALVVGWDDEVTLQCEGEADVVTGAERDRCLASYVAQYPDGRDRAKDPDIVLVRVRLDWGRLSDYRPDSFGTDELEIDDGA